MDPDVKAALVALSEAQAHTDASLAKLAERVDGLNATMAVLASAQVRLTERVDGLAATMVVLASAQARTEERMQRSEDRTQRFEERMEWFAEQMLRGFNGVSARVSQAEERIDKLEG